MSNTTSPWILTALGAALASLAAAAAGPPVPATVEGEVTAVQERGMAGTERRYTEIALRTRQREEVRLRLGPAERTPPCKTGDRVRVRLMGGAAVEGAWQARAMWNQQTGQRFRFREANGDPVRARIRERARDGSCDGLPRLERRHRSDTNTGTGRRGGRGGSSTRGGGR